MPCYKKGDKRWRKYKTRKDYRYFGEEYYTSIRKKNKQQYNRQLRNGKDKLRELKNSQWKKLYYCDIWNWS